MTNGIGRVGWRTYVSPLPNPLWNGMLAYYTGDNTADDAKGTAHGTLTNGTTYGTGKINGGFSFDGINDTVTLSNTVTKFSSSTPFTYNVWVKAVSRTGFIYMDANAGMAGTAIGFYGGTIAFYIGDVAGLFGSGIVIPLNTWTMVTITYNGIVNQSNNLLFYTNGTFVYGLNMSTEFNLPNASSNKQIGSGGWRSYFNGNIDELGIWGRELTAAEVTELYNAGAGKQYVAPAPAVSYLLDTYGGVSVAYSLRKLSSTYTGSAIRVRRSSDNTEQNIGFIGNDLDTTSLTSFVGAGNGFVTTWYDQSGNGNNSTQTTASKQPQIVNNGIIIMQGTKPSFTFSQSNGFNLTSELNLSNFTILWVSKKATTVSDSSIILSGLDGAQFMGDDINGQGNPLVNNASGGFISTGQGNTSASNLETTYHLSYMNRRNSTQAVGQFNGSNNNYNNSVSSLNCNIQRISQYANGNSAYNYVGNIQEIVIYSTDKSSDRTGLETNINTYYTIY